MSLSTQNSGYITTTGQIGDSIVTLAKMKTEIGNANKTFTWNSSGVPTAASVSPGWVLVGTTSYSAESTKDLTLSANEVHMVVIDLICSASGADVRMGPNNTNSASQYLLFTNGSYGRTNNTDAYHILGTSLNVNCEVMGSVTFNKTRDAQGKLHWAGNVVSSGGTSSIKVWMGGTIDVTQNTTTITISASSGTLTGQVHLYKAQ